MIALQPHLIVVCIDNYSKFAEVILLSDKRAETVLRCIDDFISRYGRIGILRVDNGKEFDNDSLKDLAMHYGTLIKFGSTRNPQPQSSVERIHSTILGLLKALLFGTTVHWTGVLSEAMKAYDRSLNRCFIRSHEGVRQQTPRNTRASVASGGVDGISPRTQKPVAIVVEDP